MILVTGSTGNAGSAVVRSLVEAGEDVRALIRSGRDGPRLPEQVQVAVGDLDQPQTLRSAFDGVRGAFLLSGYRGLGAMLGGMREAGVERVVLLSSSAAPDGDASNAIARYHIESERLVRESGLAWTFLQPNSFMSNTLGWVPQLRAGDVVRAPFADVAVATIDPLDLGAVAARALGGDGHAGRSYRLSGPQSLRPADRVATLARVLGRELRCEALSDAEARRELSADMAPEYVDAFLSFFADGALDESQVLPTVEQLTGRPPRSFEQWAGDHAGAFR